MKPTATHFGSLVSLAGVGLFAAACGTEALNGGSNEGLSRACDNRATESTCADYPTGATMSDVQGSCDGALTTASCPTERAVGSCSVLAARGALAGRPLTNRYYGHGPRAWTETTARQACDALAGSYASAADGRPGDVSRGLGQGCELDTQCARGLTCRQNYVAGQCTTQKTCTLVCQGNATCEAVSPKGRCFQGCANERICMLTP